MAPDPRRLLRDSWADLSPEQHERLRALAAESWEACLTASREQLVKGVDIVCRDCGQKRLYDIPVQVPDILTRARAFQIFAEEGFGKQAETQVQQVSITVRTVQELAALPDEELAAIAGAEEAEWAPLELEAEAV